LTHFVLSDLLAAVVLVVVVFGYNGYRLWAIDIVIDSHFLLICISSFLQWIVLSGMGVGWFIVVWSGVGGVWELWRNVD